MQFLQFLRRRFIDSLENQIGIIRNLQRRQRQAILLLRGIQMHKPIRRDILLGLWNFRQFTQAFLQFLQCLLAIHE